MRKKIVGSSWKMHINSINDGIELAKGIRDRVGDVEDVEIFILPTFPMIKFISDIFEESTVRWGAQNMCFAEKGAFTGEVPPQVLKELGCSYVELGHAERRAMFNESDEITNIKTKLALKYGLTPIVCIGETQEDLDKGFQKIRLRTQVLWTLNEVEKSDVEKIIFAYEPVWAIGKDKAAEPAYVQELHAFIREVIKEAYGSEISEAVRIIYGGSVSPDSAKVLTKHSDIDGLFIGRFGLKAENFESMVKSAKRQQ